ncbi:MAG: response regulator [Thaumarchaeota archaeon]|nr:response regulator [Nitrososphaerota archaeon]
MLKDTLISKFTQFKLLGHTEEKLRVLVADDNQDILALFSELLRLKNFDVVGTATSGKEAVKVYNFTKPHISFLDVAMPDGDGIYALEKIRETDPKAIVIMVTSDISPITATRLEQLHASAIVYKPFDIEDIIKIVKGLVPDTNNGRLKFFN